MKPFKFLFFITLPLEMAKRSDMCASLDYCVFPSGRKIPIIMSSYMYRKRPRNKTTQNPYEVV